MQMLYKNHRGGISLREIDLGEFPKIQHEPNNEWHGDAIIMPAWDVVKEAHRDFALEDTCFLNATPVMGDVFAELERLRAAGNPFGGGRLPTRSRRALIAAAARAIHEAEHL